MGRANKAEAGLYGIGTRHKTNKYGDVIVLSVDDKNRYYRYVEFVESGNVERVYVRNLKIGDFEDKVRRRAEGKYGVGTKHQSTLSGWCEVIEYVDRDTRVVRFDNTKNEKVVTVASLKAGFCDVVNKKVRSLDIGSIHPTKDCGDIRIESKIGRDMYEVTFIRSKEVVNAGLYAIRSGNLRDSISKQHFKKLSEEKKRIKRFNEPKGRKIKYNVGCILQNNQGLSYEILERINSSQVVVMFLVSGSKRVVTTSAINKGSVPDRDNTALGGCSGFYKYGVGYIGHNHLGEEYTVVENIPIPGSKNSKAKIRFSKNGHEKIVARSSLVSGSVISSNVRGSKHGYSDGRKGYLYVLVSDQCCKIGITHTPKQRHKKLKSDTPFDFQLYRLYEHDDGSVAKNLEKHLHNIFKDKRQVFDQVFDGCYEWFSLTEIDLIDMESLITSSGMEVSVS